jgi:polar amino acid transport system permease protein
MEAILSSAGGILSGAWLTIWLVGCSGIAGVVLGLVFGVMKSSPFRALRFLASIYVNFIRGIPVLIILMFLYYGLPLIFSGAVWSQNLTALIGLSIYAGAYLAEVFRGSIEAIPRGQSEAAAALGMGYVRRLKEVVLPQAVKISIPPNIGVLISMLKASAFVSVIGATDLTGAGRIISSINHNPLQTWVVIGVVYFVISYPLSLLGRWAEWRVSPGAKRVTVRAVP